jgi:hypothetical protein
MYSSIVLTDPERPGAAQDVVLRPTPLAANGRGEAWLRDFLLAHPSTLPTGDIDPTYAEPLPVCRELRTPAGPVDCLFVTRFGGLVVVECKLWRNPQARREVVGQILDYAKELAAWDYADLQREVSIARGERGVDALHRIVAARFPDVEQAPFVDAVARNLARGRLMLLVAGDGIREGTEAIVQYVDRHAGLQLTFGLVEMAGYAMPDGRLLVQPRLLARTTNIERAVIRLEGRGADLAEVISLGDAPLEAAVDETAERGNDVTTSRRGFDPVVKDADRRWRAEFARRARFDDPAQALGSSGFGRVYLPLPVPWAWITAYSSRSQNRVGDFLSLRGEAGRAVFEGLARQRDAVEDEISTAVPHAEMGWSQGEEVCRVGLARAFPGAWSPEQEATQLEWLLAATNAFVNSLRPRVLRLLPRADAK